MSDKRQCVALDGVTSDWMPVLSGVVLSSILRPFLFVIFANVLPDYIQTGSTLALFAYDSKLFRTLDTSDWTINLEPDGWSPDLER